MVQGVTCAASGAIAGAVIVLGRRAIFDIPTILIFLVSGIVLLRTKLPEPALVVIAAVVGVVIKEFLA